MVEQQADDADGSGTSASSEPESGQHAAGASEGAEHAGAAPATEAGSEAETTHALGHESGDGQIAGWRSERMAPAERSTAGHDQGAPTVVQNRAVPEPQGAQPAPSRAQRPSLNVGETVWKIASVLATAVKVICYALAVVLVVFILLTFVGVNPQNAVAQFVGSFADAVVLDFRDLFLIPSPPVALVVNYGLAAVFWIVVGEIASRLIRFVGAQFS